MTTPGEPAAPGESPADVVARDDDLYAPHLRTAPDPYHRVLADFARRCNAQPGMRILELGARAVSGPTRRHLFAGAAEYVGFDIHAGPNVDVVGDAHALSRHFPAGHFDAVFSCSVFEHLAFPWKVVMETNRVLKTGGLCYVSTHPAWPPHELPWDFWRFPAAGLRLLFCEPLGFRVLEAREGVPARLHSLSPDAPTRGVSGFDMAMGVALVAEKTHDYDAQRLRWDVPLESVLDSVYPDRIGGAVAAARLDAPGASTTPPTQKVVGPRSAWLALRARLARALGASTPRD